MTVDACKALAVANDGLDANRRLEAWLHDRCGLHFGEADLGLMGQRLARVVEQFGLQGLGELAREIERDKNHELTAAVVHAASTNHTYFFREMDTLDFYRRHLFDLAKSQGEIRVWSAATSTGDEAYTCAIIAVEALGLEEAQERVKILGTDISAPVIETAELGIYRRPNLEYTPDHLRPRFFRPLADGRVAVSDDIKRMCTFRRMNLKHRPYPFQKKFDIVLCRNVLYYFRIPTQREVLHSVHEVVQPGGILLTDVSFTLRDLRVPWNTVRSGAHRKI
ncbi:protein-glutamate O-methyltransferase CheR [Methylocystis sp. IM3]|uniref:CheR family methyltransferase n=1 Tax=unclassified Methylocystis TaxID=2625913 RepID=UPI0030F7E228